VEDLRTYGRKQFKRYVDRATRAKTETRDAIIWDVVEEDRVCQVKIQGSTEFIYAHYPRNQTTIPKWCRIGNAVRIVHKGGNRGYVEIAGEGRAAPTGLGTPSVPTPADAVLTGLAAWATSPETMSITVDSGTYRIDGTIYNSDGTASNYYVMDDDPITMDDDPVAMDTSSGAIVIEAAPADGYYRYDAIVLGANGVFDVIKGTEVTADPVKPDVPADHVLITYVLVVGGVTKISQSVIGLEWTTPRAVYILAETDPPCETGLTWDSESPPDVSQEATITATLYDQYSTVYSGTWTWTFEIIAGDGVLFRSGTGQGTSITFSGGASVSVIYRRPVIDGDIAANPAIIISIAEDNNASSRAHVCLYTT
jgi:hypothetical protein